MPDHLGVDHFAAFPTEWPRRIILGWSPPGICVECGEGRRPAVTRERIDIRPGYSKTRNGRREGIPQSGGTGWKTSGCTDVAILGYVCACTPYTDHPERRRLTVTPTRTHGRGRQPDEATGTRHHGNDWPERQPVRDYHLDGWVPPPTRPAVVFDPFGGTGTTALVASVLGRVGISVDRSADYCRIARWRTTDPAQRAKAARAPRPPKVPDSQLSLLDVLEAG